MTDATQARRRSLTTLGVAAMAAVLPIAALAQSPPASALTDADILNFALNIEYAEAEYYLSATRGYGLGPAELGAAAGPVRGARQVPFQNSAIRQFAEELALDEAAHVRFLRRTLGRNAIPRPPIDFQAGFGRLGRIAGLGDFDPFRDEESFLLGGMTFEDVGVTAYKGASAYIHAANILKAAAGILAVEGYHMGMVRSTLFRLGPRAQQAANAISAARDRLDGPQSDDQGIVVDGHANIVPADANGVAFGRTPEQVLRVFYLTDRPGVSGGGFYPAGVNGAVRTT